MQAGTQFKLRLPDDMHERLKADAVANNRTMNAEIVARLSGQQRTLRDEFAMHALCGCLAAFSEEDRNRASAISSHHLMTIFAEHSYGMADAMMKAREAQP